MKYLIDTSVLIAWLWRNHRFHHFAEGWGKDNHGRLAVCPLTEVMFLRVSTSQRFGATLEAARESLSRWLDQFQPECVPADFRVLDGRKAPSSAKLFDWYFADLAEKHDLRWATLDDKVGHPAAVPIYR